MLRLAVFLGLVLTTEAFAFSAPKASFGLTTMKVKITEEAIDFDAPLERQIAVGNIQVSSALNELSTRVVENDDDELDVDSPVPMHLIRSSSQHSNDRTDFDAPLYRRKHAGNVVLAGEGFSLDHEIELDQECYMGKDMSFDDCVDFDPPKLSP